MLTIQTSLKSAAPALRRAKFPASKSLRFRLNRSLNKQAKQRISSSIRGLPALTGSPLSISSLPQLTAYRGKLISGDSKRGAAVHAASFIRRREIVLESELFCTADLPLILVHEIFHFVWVRLGNRKRAAYTALLRDEQRGNARGEVGESSCVRKRTAGDSRDYVCESFCDTAAWLYAKGAPQVTLAARWQARRKAWFEETFNGPINC